MIDFTLEDIEFVKILAHTDSTVLQLGLNDAVKNRFDTQIGAILCEYYRENTRGIGTKWIERFEKAGITKDEGKAAIACARRLGISIT